MKRRTLTTIEFVDNPLKIPVRKGNSARYRISESRITSEGNEHVVVLFIEVKGDYHWPMRSPTNWLYSQLQQVGTVNLANSITISEHHERACFNVRFNLTQGNGFCESALEVGFKILGLLGIEENVARDYLRSLCIKQETQVEYHYRPTGSHQWMSYTQYLLLTNKVLSHRTQKQN